MVTFSPDMVLKIIGHINPDVVADLELDDMELENVVESINEDSELQDMLANVI